LYLFKINAQNVGGVKKSSYFWTEIGVMELKIERVEELEL